MNTTEKREYFQTFGFLISRQAFTAQEMRVIADEFDDLMGELRGGHAFDGAANENRAPFIELRPVLSRLAVDERIHGTVRELLGNDSIWAGSEGNITIGDHLWHPDRPGDAEEISYVRIKTMLYLDQTSQETGALRVIPGSHRLPMHTAIEVKERHQHGPTLAPFGVPGADIPCFFFESLPGDVLFFNQSIWHAVFQGWIGRRYIALKYAPMPTTPKQLSSLHYYSRGKIFQPHKSFAENDDQRIRQLVDRLSDLSREYIPAFVDSRPG